MKAGNWEGPALISRKNGETGLDYGSVWCQMVHKTGDYARGSSAEMRTSCLGGCRHLKEGQLLDRPQPRWHFIWPQDFRLPINAPISPHGVPNSGGKRMRVAFCEISENELPAKNEITAAEAWCAVLDDVQKIGSHSDFFTLAAAHSWPRVSFPSCAALSTLISPCLFFENATFAAIAEYIGDARRSERDAPVAALPAREKIALGGSGSVP